MVCEPPNSLPSILKDKISAELPQGHQELLPHQGSPRTSPKNSKEFPKDPQRITPKGHQDFPQRADDLGNQDLESWMGWRVGELRSWRVGGSGELENWRVGEMVIAGGGGLGDFLR